MSQYDIMLAGGDVPGCSGSRGSAVRVLEDGYGLVKIRITARRQTARRTSPHRDTTSMVLRRNAEYEYYFHKPMGKGDFVTYHIHGNGEFLLKERGLKDGDYIPSSVYRELWESRYLYCKERLCPELPSGPPKIPRAIRETYEKAKRELGRPRAAAPVADPAPVPEPKLPKPEPRVSKKQKRREQRAAERQRSRRW